MASPKKRMIWTIAALTIIIVAAVVTSCFAMQWIGDENGIAGDKAKGQAVSGFEQMTTEKIAQEVIAKMDYKDLSKTAKDQISKHYVIPDGLVKDSTVYLSASPDSAFEISCFEIADLNYQSQLDKVIADHIMTKSSGFKDSPKEYQLLQKYTLAHDGLFTLVVVEENSAAAGQLFQTIVK